MRYLNSAYIRNHRAKIGHRRGALVVSSPDGTQKIPLEAVEAVVLLGGGQMTSQALAACVRRGVRVAALNPGGSVRFLVGGATSGNVHLRTAHYQAVVDDRHSLEMAKSIVAAKLQNSRKVVARWARDAKNASASDGLSERAGQLLDRVARVAAAPNPDKLRGIEGDGARVYFRAVSLALSSAPLTFSARTRRPPRDPVNALLGFLYGLLVSEFTGAVESVGLDYQMGFFHRPRSGRPSLALDLAEELRALTDRFVVALVRRQQMADKDFTRTPGGGVYLTDDARPRLIQLWEEHKEDEMEHQILGKKVGRWAIPGIQATLLARHLRGDLPAYPPFILS